MAWNLAICSCMTWNWAVSATLKDKKESIPPPSTPKYRKGKRSGKKAEPAAAPPAGIAKLTAQFRDQMANFKALREQVAKLTELITQHHF
ncbi:hypothetical protein GQ54DRAFT_297975 [Martensiomyces pterosporus]|nr:hypothetical protein GQ54DRAFT_297975 [Martensiomyces pterosporus]